MDCGICTTICSVLGGLVGVMFIGCYLRILPPALMRVWFGVATVGCVLGMASGCIVVDLFRFVGVPRKYTQLICGIICSFYFKLSVWLSPHIKLHIDQSGVKGGLSALVAPSAVALNHTSFFDVFAFITMMPWGYIYNCRTLMKASLRKIPIFGGVFDRVGHFPVYFKSDEDGNFSVDKDRQAPVMERVNSHIKNGGRIALFPEGVVNKTPEQLRDFRRGSFALIAEHKLPLYFIVSLGNGATWGATEGFGGHAADIYFAMGEYKINWDNADEADPLKISEGLQKKMQATLDELIAKRDKKKQ